MEKWQTSAAGEHFQTLLDGVRRGDWQLVGDRDRAEAVLADVQEISDLLGAGYRFRPKSSFGERGTEMWLPEVGAHVQEATLDAARSALAQAMLRFALDWEEHLRHVPDLRLKAGYVRRIQLAGDEAGVLAMLDRDAQAEIVAPLAARTPQDFDGTKPRRWMGPHERIAQVSEALSQERAPEESLLLTRRARPEVTGRPAERSVASLPAAPSSRRILSGARPQGFCRSGGTSPPLDSMAHT